MKQAHRFSGPGKPYEGLTRVGQNGPTWTGVVRLVPEALEEPLRWQKPQRIFVNSMSDLFHEGLSDDDIDQVFAVMTLAPQHTFQVLTKRPLRMREYLESTFGTPYGERRRNVIGLTAYRLRPDAFGPGLDGTMNIDVPLPNVWLGVSVEDQATADERIPLLLETPAAVRFVSYEPALGPVDFGVFAPFNWTPIEPSVREHLRNVYPNGLPENSLNAIISRMKVDWVIVGGESGPNARPFDLAWARSTIAQCKPAGVPCFMKQLGAFPHSGDAPAGRASKSGAWLMGRPDHGAGWRWMGHPRPQGRGFR
jgi:protein gp37